jgi:hypothetical protein
VMLPCMRNDYALLPLICLQPVYFPDINMKGER